MPEARVQLAIEVEVEGAEDLTALRRELEQLGQTGSASIARLDASLASTLSHLGQSRELVAAATQSFLQNHRQLFSSLEPIFQGLFARLLTGARGFRDALKHLLADLLRLFLRTIEQIVGGWLSGFRQMSALGGGFGGGVLGVLGPMLSSGLGFQFGLGGTPPTFPTGGGGGGSASNLGLLSQLGIPVRDLTLGGLTIPGGLLASGGLFLGLTGVQRGSPVLGALGGAAAGFAFGGPIGAVIGAIAGLLGGIFSRGKKKRQAARIAEEGFAEMRRIVEQFKAFQIDFESAFAQINAVWEQMQAAWRQLGKSIFKRSLRGEQPEFNQIVAELKQIQQAREARTNLIAALPIPEFLGGGFVRAEASRRGGTGDARLLAFLHQGEAVLNRRAVQSLGPSFIELANRAPSFQQGGPVGQTFLSGRSAGTPFPPAISVNIYPSSGMNEEQLADYAIRKLRRLLADQGLRLGS